MKKLWNWFLSLFGVGTELEYGIKGLEFNPESEILVRLEFFKHIFNVPPNPIPALTPDSTLWDLRQVGFLGSGVREDELNEEWEEWVIRRIYQEYNIIVQRTTTLTEIIERIKYGT